MDLFPIKTTILKALSPKDEPPGVCPQCDEDDASPREAVVAALIRSGHTEEEAREIEQSMFDAAREMFETPPPKDDREPQKDN